MEVLFIVVFALVICVVIGAHKVDMLRRDFTYLKDGQDFLTSYLDKVNRKMYALEEHLQLKYIPETTEPAYYEHEHSLTEHLKDTVVVGLSAFGQMPVRKKSVNKKTVTKRKGKKNANGRSK